MTGYELQNQNVVLAGDLTLPGGNVISSHWLDHLKTPAGKPYLAAAVILSEVIFWFRPLVTRDQETGEELFLQKFRADLWQANYKQIADRWGLSHRQVREAFAYLVDQGLLTRELRTVEVGGRTYNNLAFYDLDVDRVREIGPKPVTIGPAYYRPSVPGGEQVDQALQPTEFSGYHEISGEGYHEISGEGITKFREETSITNTSNTNTKDPGPVGQPAEALQEKSQETDHQKVMRLYQEALGYPIPNGGQEGRAAKGLLKTYSVQDIMACYRWLATDPWWSAKHISLQVVKKQIGPWIKAGRPPVKGKPGQAQAGPAAKLTVDQAEALNAKRLASKLGTITGA